MRQFFLLSVMSLLYAAAFLGASAPEEPFDLTVCGFIDTADGIGKQAIDLMKTAQSSMRVSFVPVGLISRDEFVALPLPIQKMVATSGKALPGKVLIFESYLSSLPQDTIPQRDDFWNQLGLPEKDEGQIRIAYTMFESSRIAQNWVYILNTCFDAAVVPDPFFVSVYKKSGVTIPVFCLPLGREYAPMLNEPLKQSRGKPFVFANYSTCIPRKNFPMLIRGFAEAFGNSPDVELRLGWRFEDGLTYRKVLEEIGANKLSNVKIERTGVSHDQYLSRFKEIDCYVNIATGEGFSIQPREAMALGIPVIVTDNTAQKTICSSGLVRVVPSPLEIPAEYTFPGHFGVQYQCRSEDVAAALHDVFDHYEDYIKKGPQARAWASEYSISALAPLYQCLIRPKKVILGSEDRIVDAQTLMTSNQSLAQKYWNVRLGTGYYTQTS